MNEKLQSLIKLEKQYRSVAPNSTSHKQVLSEISALQKTLTASPEMPYVKDMIQDVKDNTANRSSNIEWFYDKAITATGLNKASQFTFGSSADKWVPLQIQKQNIVKANEDVAGNIAQLEWQSLDKQQANELAWENAIANLKQLKVNADIQGRQADITEANTAAQLKSQQDQLAETQRQFNIKAWLNPDWTPKSAATKAVSTVSKPKATTNSNGNYTNAPKEYNLASSWFQVQAPYNNVQKDWIPFVGKDWKKYMIKDGKLLPIQ